MSDKHLPTTKLETYTSQISCGNCGRTGHKATTCSRPATPIDRIGVEVEGWWRDWIAITTAADDVGASGTNDGSLVADPSGETRRWEWRTRPGSLASALKAVHALYPDKYHRSAGMHIHMSFNDMGDAMALCSREFSDYALASWRAWGEEHEINEGSEFWSRLAGNNQYCRLLSDADISACTRGDRYRWLNYSAYRKHKTIELRLLPLFCQERLALAAIRHWYEMVDTYVRTVATWAGHEATFSTALSEQIEVVSAVDLPSLDDVRVTSTVEMYPDLTPPPGGVVATRATAARVLAAALEV